MSQLEVSRWKHIQAGIALLMIGHPLWRGEFGTAAATALQGESMNCSKKGVKRQSPASSPGAKESGSLLPAHL